MKDKVQKKKQRVVQPELPEDKLELAAFELKSKNNKMYFYYFVENYKSAPLKVITEELQITDAPIKALVKRDSFQKSMWKYTEIRMTMMILNKQNHFHLRRNKNKLLHRFYHQLQMKLIIHFTIWCYRKWKDRSIFTIYSGSAQERKRSYRSCS